MPMEYGEPNEASAGHRFRPVVPVQSAQQGVYIYLWCKNATVKLFAIRWSPSPRLGRRSFSLFPFLFCGGPVDRHDFPVNPNRWSTVSQKERGPTEMWKRAP